MVKRTSKGTFSKGVSGNPTGRPKAYKATPMTAKDSKKYKDDPKKALLHLLNTAETRDEVFKYAKELLPYVTPRLASIQSEVKTEKTVTIKIEGFEPLSLENKADTAKVVEGECVEELTKESLEQLKKDKLSQVKPKKGKR